MALNFNVRLCISSAMRLGKVPQSGGKSAHAFMTQRMKGSAKGRAAVGIIIAMANS
jgi:hypothetical protein